MEINCNFGIVTFYDENLFTCSIKDQKIPESCEFKIIGQLEGRKTTEDVLCVEFENCTVTKIPQGLTKIFPNMNILRIFNSKLKDICKNDLVEYNNFKRFHFDQNELKFLPGNLFEGFKNLELISFWGNKLKVIEPNILDGLDKLKYVNFQGNPNYEKFYSTYPDSGSNATLDEVKYELLGKYPEFLKDMFKISAENLIEEIQQLKDSKLKLETELEQEKVKNFKLTDIPQKGFFNDLKTFTKDEATKDFQIQIEDHLFPVHKFLLAARSPTLAEILKNNPEVKILDLVDISV